MAFPDNYLQQVVTYNESGLALLLNSFAFISTSNGKFKGFNDDIPKNLGDTVSYDEPPRFNTTASLVANFQGANQRVRQLTVNSPASVSYAFTAQQFIFNSKDYMSEFGRGAIAELGTEVERDVASVAETNTYRFFGDGITPISTYGQLGNALAFFRNFGSAKTDTKAYLSDLTVPQIINSGLNQFVPTRNDREAMSWEIGDFGRCSWYESNLLKTHLSGSEGNAGVSLTVVSTVKDSNDAVIQITFSGASAPSDANSIKAYDKFQVSDGISGQPNRRFLTFIGHAPSQSPVQFKATADAGSTAGSQVTVNIYPPLKASAGQTQNVTHEITPGMQVTVLPDHRCGLINSGNPLFLAMPSLPQEVPFPTSTITDPDTGISLRQYFGSLFGQNQRGMIHDTIWGRDMSDDYAMMVALPV